MTMSDDKVIMLLMALREAETSGRHILAGYNGRELQFNMVDDADIIAMKIARKERENGHDGNMPAEKSATIQCTGDGYADGEMVYDCFTCGECNCFLGEDDPIDVYGWTHCPFCGAKFSGTYVE